jgi:hypothetical protein
MVIGNFDVARPVIIVRPLEAHPPLPIDPDAELPVPVAAQRLKSIAGQKHQVASANRRFQNIQPPLGLLLERLKLPYALTGGETLRALIAVLGRNVWLPKPTMRYYRKIDALRQD